MIALVTTAVTAGIVGGSPAAGHPAVVGLVAHDAIGCTGVLIDPRVVLTAGHCAALAPDAIVIGEELGGARVEVLASITHPDYSFVGLVHDLGFLILAAPVDDVAIVPRAEAAVAVGASVELVGFGATGDADDAGVKRAGAAVVAEVEARHLRLAPGPAIGCRGDSGGPVLVEVDGGWAVAAIVSSGDAACTRTSATRLDVYADFVDEVLARAYAPVAPGAGCWSELQCDGACVRLDPGDDVGACACDDCEVDVAPGQPGAACDSRLDCSDLACVELDGEPGARCYPLCVGGGDSCRAGGGACVPVEDEPETEACVEQTGGCAAGGGSIGTALLVSFGLAVRRRRLRA